MDSSPGPTRAILFDLVGVLLLPSGTYTPDETVEAFDAAIGHCHDDDGLRSSMMKRFDLSKTQFDQLLVRLARKYVPFQPVGELLPRLSSHYRLGILNNGTTLTISAFDSCYGLMKNFDLVFCSGREGCCKPEARFYQRALKRLGLPANECLFMDDSLENIAVADSLGMKTIHWPDPSVGFSRFEKWLQSERKWTT